MKNKIKIIIIFILGIIVSIIINVYSIAKVTTKEITHKQVKQLESTSDPDYINGVYSSSSTISSNISNLEKTNCRMYTSKKYGDTVSIGFTTSSTMIGIIIGSWVNINSFNIQPSVIALNNGVNTFTMPTLRDSSGNIANSTAKDVVICWFYGTTSGTTSF